MAERAQGGKGMAEIERPAGLRPSAPQFGSDVAALTLRALGIRYVALNPGASFRGLHDSLVNLLGNRDPQMLLCLHEEHAVAVAHGYAKVTGQAMAAAVHSNVGLFHATMAVFNAWCDRMPVLVIGATGPLDATKRRPWIEWIHTARDQGAIVRDYTKWDDQPASPEAVPHALIRGKWLAETAPQAPVYINLDAGLQEEALTAPVAIPDPARLAPSAAGGVGREATAAAADLLRGARSPLILMGRVSRSTQAWQERVALAEALGAKVLTDLKVGAAFPTDHVLHAAAPGIYPTPPAVEALAAADVILSLDWVDLAGTLAKLPHQPPQARIVQVSSDHTLHNGWSMDYQALPPVDLLLPARPGAVVRDLCTALDIKVPDGGLRHEPVAPADMPPVGAEGLTMAHLAAGLRQALAGSPVSLSHLPLSWDGACWPFRHPLDFLGSDGGGGIGGGPGIAVGAALALQDSGCLPVAVCGDGDFLMGAMAVWTAAHYRLPLLIVVANNRSFYNDEVHQERVARMRGRPSENKWIGQRMTDPEIDLAALARAQGASGFGPVRTLDELARAYAEAAAAVKADGVAVVDVHVAPGYTPAFQAALTKPETRGDHGAFASRPRS
jgi:thiamine pyrophosphate-dependent acetolactate synthase large subunit-like protein